MKTAVEIKDRISAIQGRIEKTEKELGTIDFLSSVARVKKAEIHAARLAADMLMWVLSDSPR